MRTSYKRFVRPYLEKILQLKPNRWWGFIRDLSAGTKVSPFLWLPKVPWCMLRGFNQHEFRIYRPHLLSWKTLATYHSTIDNVRLIEAINNQNQLHLLRDKGLFLKRFSHRIGRDYLDLRESSAEAFTHFVEQHSHFVAKAYNLAMGVGIEVIARSSVKASYEDLRQRLLREEKFVVEEFIQQHSAVSLVYPHSVNSVRIYTLLKGRATEVVFPPMIRFGSGGGRIDANGEMTVLLAPHTGRWLAGAVNLQAQDITVHPDTCVAFQNVSIPFLSEAIKLVKAAACEIPEVRYIGWDVAITPDGPVLIEGNGAPSISTMQLLLSRWHEDRSGCRQILAALT